MLIGIPKLNLSFVHGIWNVNWDSQVGFEFCTFRNLDEFDNEVSCLNFTIMSTFATIGLNDTLKMSPSVNALIFRRGCGSSQWRTKVNNLFVAVGVVQAWASGGGGTERWLYLYPVSISVLYRSGRIAKLEFTLS